MAGGLTDLRLSCAGAAAGTKCRGVLRSATLRAKRHLPRRHRRARRIETVTLGHRHYSLPTGASRSVALRLTGEALVLLSEHQLLHVQAIATVRGGKEAFRRPIVLR